MEAHPVNHSFAIVPIWFVVMLVLGTLVAVGALWASRRKRKPGPIVGILAGGTIASFVLLMVGFTSVAQVRHAQVEPRRPELQQRLNLLGAELREHELRRQAAFDPILIADHSVPVEAVRPSAKPEAVAGPAEWLISDSTGTSLPDWALTPVSTEDDRQLVVVRSEQFADPAAAAAEALQAATDLVRRNFDEFNRLGHYSWSLDPQTVHSAAVRRTFTEPIQRSAGEHDFTVYRTYLLVELSPSVRDQIEPIWREQVSQGRSAIVVVLLGLLTALAALVTGYFRLADRTDGRFLWPLRFATVGAAALFGLVGIVGAGTAGDFAKRHALERTPMQLAPPSIETIPTIEAPRSIEPPPPTVSPPDLQLIEVSSRDCSG